jgi:hypothetical protein
LYDAVMARRSRSRNTDLRGATVSALTSVCAGAPHRYSRGGTRDEVIAELRAISDDPDVLAEAAAHIAVRHPDALDPTAGVEEGLALLFAAGADREAYERHCTARREFWASKPFDLGRFADMHNRPQD